MDKSKLLKVWIPLSVILFASITAMGVYIIKDKTTATIETVTPIGESPENTSPEDATDNSEAVTTEYNANVTFQGPPCNNGALGTLGPLVVIDIVDKPSISYNNGTIIARLSTENIKKDYKIPEATDGTVECSVLNRWDDGNKDAIVTLYQDSYECLFLPLYDAILAYITDSGQDIMLKIDLVYNEDKSLAYMTMQGMSVEDKGISCNFNYTIHNMNPDEIPNYEPPVSDDASDAASTSENTTDEPSASETETTEDNTTTSDSTEVSTESTES